MSASESEPRSASRRRALVVTGLVVLAFLTAQRIPIPGIDPTALASHLSVRAPFIIGWYGSAVGGMLLALVVFRGVAALFDRRSPVAAVRASHIACASYLLLGLLRGFSVARGAEWLSGVVDTSVLSVQPGPFFRLMTALSLGAGAAVDWWLASVISERGVGRGPLMLIGASLLLDGTGHLAAFGSSAGRDGLPGMHALIALGAGLPAGLVLIGLARRDVLTFPVRIREGLELESWVELVILPYIFGALVLEMVGWVSAVLEPQGPTLAWLSEIDTLAAVAAASGIAMWLFARRAQGFVRRRLVLGALVPVLATAPVLAAIAFDPEATLSRFFGGRRGFEGDTVFEVLLSAEDGDGPRDAPILSDRLAALGVETEVLEAALGRIRLRLTASEEIDHVLKKVLAAPGMAGTARELERMSITGPAEAPSLIPGVVVAKRGTGISSRGAFRLASRPMSGAWSVASFGRSKGR